MTFPAFEPEDWLRNSEALRRAARALVFDEAAGDDLAQSAWLSALQHPPRQWSRSWFLRVLRNKAFDRLRRGEPTIDGAVVEPTAPGAGDLAERLEVHRILASAVEALRGPYRQVVYLRYFEGQGPSEIAEQLGVPVKTIKTRLGRALAQLRVRLERDLGGKERDWRGLVLAICDDTSRAALGSVLTTGGLGLMVKKLLALGVALGLLCGVVLWGPYGRDPLAPAGATRSQDTPDDLVVGIDRDPARDAEGEGRLSVVDEGTPGHEATPAPTTGSIVVHASWSDGEPAAGVAIHVRRSVRGLPSEGLATEVTDKGGRARFGGLAPEQLSVRADRGVGEGDPVIVALEAGAEERVDVTLPGGVRVNGIVRSATGNPVPGAGIWLTTRHGDWQGGRVIGTADAGGRYSLRDVPHGQSLGALAAGHSPSKLVDLETLDLSVEPVAIDLALGPPGGDLTVRVLGADGSPAAGAWVAVGPVRPWGTHHAGGRVVEYWAPNSVRCDGDGRARIVGLSPGSAPVAVRHGGHPVWQGEAWIEEGAVSELEVLLGTGFSLTGTVRDDAGEPVRGAIVRGFPKELDESFLQFGQFEWKGAFGYPITRSDQQGHYTLSGLASALTWVYASPEPAPAYRAERLAVQRAHTVVEGAEGAVLVWNPVLEDGPTIEGIVAYQDGTPMTDVFVSARDDSTGSAQSLTTTSSGRFRFLNMQVDASYTLGVQLWDAPEDAVPLEATGVLPGGDEVRLIASFEPPYSGKMGSIRGRVEDRGQRILSLKRMRVLLEMGGGSTRVGADMEGVNFTFTDCEPRTYTPIVMEGDDVVFVGEEFELGPGEDRDIGTLVTEQGGGLRVLLEHAPGTQNAEATAYIRGKNHNHSKRVELAGHTELLIENLSAGRNTITVWGQGVQSEGASAMVVAGTITEVTVALARAAIQPFEITWPQGASLGELEAVVNDSSGEELTGFGEINVTFLSRPYRRRVQLPLGTYTIEVTTRTGLAAKAPFTIESFDEELPVVVLELQ